MVMGPAPWSLDFCAALPRPCLLRWPCQVPAKAAAAAAVKHPSVTLHVQSNCREAWGLGLLHQ
jgi:hypothetical protein